MLADRAPSAWLASQTSHWAAAVVASSVAERRGPGEVADGRVAEGGLVVDDEAVAVEMGAAGDGVREGRSGRSRRGASGMGLLSAVVPTMVASPLEGCARPAGAEKSGFTTMRMMMLTTRTVRNIPPCWSFLPVATISGRRAGRGAGGGGAGHGHRVRWTIFSASGAWTKIAKPMAMRYRMIPMSQPAVGRARQVGPEDQDEGHAGDALDDRARDDEPALDELAQDRRERPVLGALLGLARDDREDERRAEDGDRAHDVQEQEQRSIGDPSIGANPPAGRAGWRAPLQLRQPMDGPV